MLILAGTTLLDIYGVERTPIEGNFDARSLGDAFVRSWIPYMECHKCGKGTYCKFAQPHPYNSAKKREIQCGVAETALRNFVERTIALAGPLDNPSKQAYLDGAFFLTKFVLEAEQSIGSTINTSFLDWLKDSAPVTFGRLTQIRDTLNSLAQCLSTLPGFHSGRSILLVEGWTEKAFLDKLKESHMGWFLDLLVECYDGKGNRRSKRIAMLLAKYRNIGYNIYAQGDADGKPEDIFKGLVDSGLVEGPRTFTFKYDFESAIPLPLLVRAMKRIGVPLTFKPSDLSAALTRNHRSVNAALAEDFGVDTEVFKMDLAAELGAMMSGYRFIWWKDERFMQSELGRFMRFIQKIE